MAPPVAIARPSLRALQHLVLVQAPLVCLGPAPVNVTSLVLHTPSGTRLLPSPYSLPIALGPSQTYTAIFRVPNTRDLPMPYWEQEGEKGEKKEEGEMLLPTSMTSGPFSPDADETRNCGMLGMIVVEFECNGEKGNRFKSFHWNIHDDIAGITASVFIVNNPGSHTTTLIKDIHDAIPGGCKFSARIRLYNTGDKDERVVLYMNKHCHSHHNHRHSHYGSSYHHSSHHSHNTLDHEGTERKKEEKEEEENNNIVEKEKREIEEKEKEEKDRDTFWPAIIPLVIKSPVITIPAKDHTTFTCQYMSLRQGVLRLPDIEIRREVEEGETETLVNKLPITIRFSV